MAGRLSRSVATLLPTLAPGSPDTFAACREVHLHTTQNPWLAPLRLRGARVRHGTKPMVRRVLQSCGGPEVALRLRNDSRACAVPAYAAFFAGCLTEGGVTSPPATQRDARWEVVYTSAMFEGGNSSFKNAD